MEQSDQLQSILKKVNLFSSLDNKSLGLIQKRIQIISYGKGEYICKEGDSSDRMYIILSGSVRVLKK